MTVGGVQWVGQGTKKLCGASGCSQRGGMRLLEVGRELEELCDRSDTARCELPMGRNWICLKEKAVSHMLVTGKNACM